MLWEKKSLHSATKNQAVASLPPLTSSLPEPSRLDKPMTDILPKPLHSTHPDQDQATLGGSLALKGELSGNEDLFIDGQLEGAINLQGHCLTVGPSGQIKANIHAGRVIILGSVSGNISARDRIEIRKTGRVVGDLVGPGISIEDGAYFKGSIEILRPEAEQKTAHALASVAAAKTTV